MIFGPPITAAMLAAGPARAGDIGPRGGNHTAQASSPLALTHAQESKLIRWARSGTVPQRVALRARIALLVSAGHAPRSIARTLGVGVNTVVRWRERVCTYGVDAISHDAPGRGRKRAAQPAWEPILRGMMAAAPPCGCHWTVRGLAAALGWSATTTARRMKQLSV